MKLLLDTHVLLWLAFGKRDKFSENTIAMLNADTHEFYVSIASIWEIAIKSALNKTDFSVNVDDIVAQLNEFGIELLPIAVAHVTAVAKLPLLHGDPFDRLLIVQAQQETLQLLTVDKKILNYGFDFVQDVAK